MNVAQHINLKDLKVELYTKHKVLCAVLPVKGFTKMILHFLKCLSVLFSSLYFSPKASLHAQVDQTLKTFAGLESSFTPSTSLTRVY